MENTQLNDLLARYAVNKNELDNYKKIVDRENAQIKSIMLDASLGEYSSDEYRAVCTVSQRETMKEDMLLEIAHKHGISEIIKTKEYIDYDALENAIYNDRISDEVLMEMDKAKETKEVVTLRVTKIKKKE